MKWQNSLRFDGASISLLLAFSLMVSARGWPQPDSLDQAHVIPRQSAEPGLTAVNANTNFTLKARPLRVDVNLVLVPVTVTDALNRPVLGLPAETFSLHEGGFPQQIRYFSVEDAPISVALVLDFSASMKNKIEYEQQAVQEFFANASPLDEYFVITVPAQG